MTNSQRRNNAIEVLQSGDTILSYPTTIKGHIVNFYEKPFREEYSWRPKLYGLDFGQLNQLCAEWLERTFDEEEILYVVRGMVRDEALGPDRFSMVFFQDCWHVVREDVMKVLLSFQRTRNLRKAFNATFIALIPKKVKAVEMKDFSPINLVNGVYKIISKVLPTV